jgi:hypothetical protein
MIPQRFDTAAEAIAWYNGWLTTVEPPKTMEGCRECSEEFGGWDPVIMWHLPDGTPVFWYIVGTGDTESLVIEGEDTIKGWGNQYYYYYAQVNGERAAESLRAQSELPTKPPPDDLPPSTPESVYWANLM